jgi:hypothetical protein
MGSQNSLGLWGAWLRGRGHGSTQVSSSQVKGTRTPWVSRTRSVSGERASEARGAGLPRGHPVRSEVPGLYGFPELARPPGSVAPRQGFQELAQPPWRGPRGLLGRGTRTPWVSRTRSASGKRGSEAGVQRARSASVAWPPRAPRQARVGLPRCHPVRSRVPGLHGLPELARPPGSVAPRQGAWVYPGAIQSGQRYQDS